MADPAIPPEAWDLIFKSGNAVSVALALVFWRVYERVGRLSTRVAVLEALLDVKGTQDGNEV